MRFGDLDALWSALSERRELLLKRGAGTTGADGVVHAMNIVQCAPTIDAAPVVHGEWERMINPYGELEGFFHHACGHQSDVASNYCSSCGAKMGGEKTIPEVEAQKGQCGHL